LKKIKATATENNWKVSFWEGAFIHFHESGDLPWLIQADYSRQNGDWN